MVQAYSQLKHVLSTRKMTVPELYRRITQHGMQVNLKSLYRLSHEHQPLERLDLRVAGAICQVCDVHQASASCESQAEASRCPYGKE
jgi:hypothetical protein